MPKFNGQNKKRNNPRYFLNETVEREEIEEGEKERTWNDAYAMGLPEPEFRAPWNSTKDMIDKLGEQAREASKAIYGYKVDVGNMTLDQIQDLLYDMSNSDVQRSMDDEAQREDDMATGMQADELDNRPKRAGMGRGPMEEEEKPKKKEKEPEPGKYDNNNGIPEKCDYVPCGPREPKTSKKKDKLKEMIEKELTSLLSEIDSHELQPPEGFMALDSERFSFAKGPAGDAMASKIDKALRKAGNFDKRGPDPRRPNIPATLFYGEMANGKKCDGRYGFCGSDEIAQALLALPETKSLFSSNEKLNSAIVHALNIELGDAFEDYFGIGRAIASKLGDAEDADTYGQAIDPRAAALQRIREVLGIK